MNAFVRRMMRAMRHNPQWLVRRAKHYESRRVSLRGRKLQLWIRRYRHRPLSMLSECFGKTCRNSRLAHPERREEFVTRTIELVQELWGNSLDYLKVVFLGSGSLLQEIILLTRLFEAVQIKKMHVVCCDQEYVNNNDDEAAILQARLNQAKTWMTYIAPLTVWSWAVESSWEQLVLNDNQISKKNSLVALICAIDVEITEELWDQWCYQFNQNSIIIVLDSEQKLREHVYEKNHNLVDVAIK